MSYSEMFLSIEDAKKHMKSLIPLGYYDSNTKKVVGYRRYGNSEIGYRFVPVFRFVNSDGTLGRSKFEFKFEYFKKYGKNPRDVPSEHTRSQLERIKQQAEFIKKEQEKPRGLALFENPRISKSTGLYKIGDKVLADWVQDRRRRGIIIGLDPSKRRKYIVKIGDETQRFSEEDLDFPSERSLFKNPRGWLNIQKVGKAPYNFMITTQDEQSALGYTETFEQAKELAKELANTYQMSIEIRGK